jgi:hypothetical protein
LLMTMLSLRYWTWLIICAGTAGLDHA